MRASRLTVLAAVFACASDGNRDSIDAPQVQLEEELRLDPNVEDFSVVNRIWVGPRGRIVVPLPQDRQLRIYDSSGTRIATAGRDGSGPGEFRSLGSMGWVADTLWVFDGAQRRVSWVGPDGAVLRTDALPASAMRGAPVAGTTRVMGFFGPSAIYPDGSMIGEANLFASAGPDFSGWPERTIVVAPPDRRGTVPREAQASADPASSQARIVARPPSYYDERWSMEVAGFSRGIPFVASPIVAYTNDGSRFAYLETELGEEGRGTFTITVFDAEGDTTLARSYPFQGLAIPERVRDSTLAAFIPPEGRPREGPADLPQRFQAIARERMPAYYPPVLAMLLGLDDSIWLTLRDSADTRRALILDGEGDPIGTLALPPRTTIRQATATHAWATQVDEDGLAAVVRFRVRR